MGGEDGVGLTGGDEGAEEVVTDGSGGFLDGLAILGGSGGDAGAVEVEGDVEAGAEGFDELLVGGGFFGGADAVVDVSGAEADTEGVAGCGVGGVEGEEEGYGVCAAGDGYADAVAGVDVGAVEGNWGGCGHAALSYRWVGLWSLSGGSGLRGRVDVSETSRVSIGGADRVTQTPQSLLAT